MAAIVVKARARLRPAVMGVGKGRADININRVARLAGGHYWLGKNPAGASDKTVHILKFDGLDGRPIAMLINYAVHCTTLGPKNLSYSGDIAGATSRYLEQEIGGDFVALWTSGAAGDQAPLYNQQTNTKFVEAMGEILAIEAQQVQERVHTTSKPRIQAAQRIVSCPGRKLAPGATRKPAGRHEFVDAKPVDIRLSLILFNQVAWAGVSGEVLTGIGRRLKADSPFNHTMMITNCNGSSGYLADDAAFSRLSYETVSTRVKSGYAEEAIVDTLVEMLEVDWERLP